MYKTIKEATNGIEQIGDVKKQNELDSEIDDILYRIKAFAETGWTLIKLNQFNRTAILPLSSAIRDSLTKLEDLVLEHRDATSDPDLREKLKLLRSVSIKKANES